MELNKETLKQARRAPTPATHRAVLAALDVLDKQPTHKPRMHGQAGNVVPGQPLALTRWAVAAAAAVTLVAVVLAVPPLRHRATNLALDVLGQAIPQADRVNPAAGGAPGLAGSANASMFSLLSEAPYPELPAISQIVGTTQTVNGITATVEEAALTVDKLYLALRITNAPRNSDISDENMSIQIDGNSTGDSSGYGNFESDTQQHILCYGLKTPVSTPGTALPVSLAFDLKQLSVQNGHQVDGALLASFKLDFTVTMGQEVLQFEEPAGAYATTAPTPDARETAVTEAQATDLSQATAMAVPVATATAEITTMPGNELPTPRPSSRPETTAMPSSASQIVPSDMDALPEPAGTIKWTTYQNEAVFASFMVPKDWAADGNCPWLRADPALNDVLAGWKGTGGSLYLCGGNYDNQGSVSRAAECLVGVHEGTYTVDGNTVYLLRNSDFKISVVVIALPELIQVGDNRYDTLTLWGTPEYINHALKTLKLDISQTK